jgi:ribosomal protein L37AE/L43A
MDSSDSRREVMNSYERVFARICLEYGWAGRSQIADAVRARSQEPANAAASLSFLLVSRGVLTEEQARTLEDEVKEVTRSGVYAEVREDDTWLGQLLVEAGSATPEQISSALDLQKEFASRKAPVPRLGEILIDQGVVTFASLQDAVQRQSRLIRLSCPSCGSRYTAESSESTKAYLCKKCAVPLTGTSRVPAAPAAEPEEVTRAAENPKKVIGKYVLTSQLGKGSMGAVYKAWDRGLRRWVAIKVLIATDNPQLVLRFRREAETAAAIQHPNIVPIYDVGENAAQPFLVMKFVEGTTLTGMSLSLDQACALVLQAAKGVAYAHQHDVVHRDLKPGNVMVDGSGHVYVMDFGLAKDLFSSTGITAPGTVMGTASYMPPEQAAGKIEQVDRRSDVYSLGAVLYELLTNRAPFRGPNFMDTIRQVLDDPVVPPTKIRTEIPPAVEQVILKALDKDQTRRYPNAADFAKALESATGKPVIEVPVAAAPAVPPPPKKSSKMILFWAIVLVILSVLAGLGVLQLIRGGAAVGPGP